ncbi:hypothetical protein [Amycolatopsis sp. MtRt-6]|uniref:hypothetical protein n=1 Tax=Amycolatopsis sp. MtRt-6 TaxID=2792782 RepID=UPI001A8CE4DA|nr:hypothetical protein [Amycolatopsis sp. MtRt-6]
MTHTGAVLALITIAVLIGVIAALITGFVRWLETRKISSGVLAGGGAFLAVTAAVVTIFSTAGLMSA